MWLRDRNEKGTFSLYTLYTSAKLKTYYIYLPHKKEHHDLGQKIKAAMMEIKTCHPRLQRKLGMGSLEKPGEKNIPRKRQWLMV